MTGAIVFDGTSGQYISKGNFDTSRGGNYGISLVCSIGYEFNWQAGWLTTTEQGSVTPRPLYLDSLAGTTLRAWDSSTNKGTEVSHSQITILGATYDSAMSSDFFGVELSVDNAQYAELEYNQLTVADSAGFTKVTPAGLTFPDLTTQTTAGLSPATASTTYAPIASGLPVGGTTGQLLSKASGTNYDTTWTTVIPGDRYLTSSTTSLTIDNADKTLTIGTGLSYSPQQDVTISESTSPSTRHMHARVTSYNSSTGVMLVNVISHTGTGTYTSWVINVGGVTPATSVAWGTITGTLSAQTDLQTALDAKANLASPTFTGTVTIPSGASISGFALLASPTFTGDPKSVTPLLTDNDTSIATTAYVKGQGYLTSATAASTYYLQTNPSGFITSSALTGYALQNGTTAFSVTSNTIRSLASDDNFVQLNETALQFGNLGTGVAGLSVSGTGITFADSTVQTTAAVAGVPEAPIDGTTYGRLNGTWTAVGGSGAGTVTYSSPYLYDTAGAVNVDDLNLGAGELTAGAANVGGNCYLDSFGLSFTASSGAVITFADSTTQSTAPHDLPIGGTTGQALVKNSATNFDAGWTTLTTGGTNVQTFGSSTTSGSFTWTKPAGAKWVEFYLIGGGGGGGSGARQATTSARGGGGGGSGSSVYYGRISAGALGGTESIVVGAGGTGGAGRVTDNNNGNSGTVGTATTFGPYTSGYGINGSFGSTVGGSAGATKSSIIIASGNTASNAGGSGAITFGGTPSNIGAFIIIPTGGGGGAGAGAALTTGANGGTGGSFNITSGNASIISSIAGGSAGQSASATQATAGTSATTNYFQAGTGGGGGFYRTATAGGTGGAGGWPGGAGGGGGASDNSFASGAGGAGANGFALIITYT
jgi:hypothetical protein